MKNYTNEEIKKLYPQLENLMNQFETLSQDLAKKIDEINAQIPTFRIHEMIFHAPTRDIAVAWYEEVFN